MKFSPGHIRATRLTKLAGTAMAAENTFIRGRLLDGSPISEPRPRSQPEVWQNFELPFVRREFLSYPRNPPSRSFLDVLEARRSAVNGPLTKEALADLLWYATGVRGWEESGRAGIPISWRPAPSGGGLHPIEIIAIPNQTGADVLHYDPENHSYDYWGGPWDDSSEERSVGKEGVSTCRSRWSPSP